MSETRGRASALPRYLLHILAVLALMWPALVNRQPFFFSDTTAYIRAADLATNMVSGGAVRTAWTRPDPIGLRHARTPAAPSTKPVAAKPTRANDGGNVMSGRSPYFGALLYFAYLASDLWLFVIGQAIVAWLLIGMALRAFELSGARLHAVSAIGLALVTPLAFYNSLLMADALAGFGILAFLILAGSRRPQPHGERLFLLAVIAISVVSHLTHIVMLAGMTGLLVLLALGRLVPRDAVRPALLAGAGLVAVGLVSVMLTGAVVRGALGRSPVLVPLVTARFIADGPGRAFIDAGCGGHRLTVCGLPRGSDNAQEWLWSRDPARGVYLFADPATRQRLSAEDTAFGRAVLAAYPLQEGGMMAWNTWRQITDFTSALMNQPCFADVACSGDQLPEAVRARLRSTPSGQDRWPVDALAALHYATVLASLIVLAVAGVQLWRKDREEGRRLLLWITLLAVAMMLNGFFGGAISEPQGRYQARIVWIVPLLALIAGLRWRVRRHAQAPHQYLVKA